MADHDIFREELAKGCPAYGHALWEPDPGEQYDAVEVGDVGFIRRGRFHRLFNILYPKDHASHRNPALVPDDHEQLIPVSGHIIRGKILTDSRQHSNHFCSKYVTLDHHASGLVPSASRPEDESQVTFLCRSRNGALLAIPVPAQSEDTVALGTFGDWMVKHIDTWYAFARAKGLGINRMEDIILVTGHHRAKSWINVAFTQGGWNAGVSFIQVSSDSHVYLEQKYVCGGQLKLGPTGEDLPNNQCIFIRGYRVARTMWVWPTLRGQAGPAPTTDKHEPGPEFDSRHELLGVSADVDHQDPLHVLFQYIAEQKPNSDMVLVHDDDLMCIDSASLKPHKLAGHLRNSAPTIQLQCDGSGAGVANVKVAMLYEQAPETRLEDRGYAEEEAHNLVTKYWSVIDTKDRETVKNAIAYARETKLGLDSMRGFSQFLQARAYHRAAKNALNLSKAVVSKLDDTGDHQYIPSSDCDSRSPCPALNALANHGILPRDGRNISAFQLMWALREHYHVSLLMAFILSFLGTFICGRWFKVDLHDFARHSYIEHDASLTHRDAMPEGLYAPVAVDKDLLHDLLNVSKDPVLSFHDLLVVRVCRNETLFKPLDRFHNAIALLEVVLTVETLRDKDGNIPKQFIREWFGEQRLPRGWSRPTTPIGIWNTSQIVKRVRDIVEEKGV